jgi:type IV pilus assembly protein PilB
MSLVDQLKQNNFLNDESADAIKKDMADNGTSIDEAAQKQGVSAIDLEKTREEYYKIPTKTLPDEPNIPLDILKYIPEESANHYLIAPLEEKDGFLEVGMVDPDDLEARDALNFISSKIDRPLKIFLISEVDFKKVIDSYKGLSGTVDKALTEFEDGLTAEEQEIARQARKAIESNGDEGVETEEESAATQIIEDAPVTKIVATVLRYAVEGESSDVHIEPMRDRVRVRFRVDGELNTSLVLPPKVHPAVVARIKILSKLKLDEKRKPQDGRFSAKILNRKIDFRVSTFPSYYGEKIVLRILDQEKGVKSLEELGLSMKNLKMIKKAIAKPYGLILISGPTGSGKTTTLYAVLKEMDKDKRNILSLEDPVEYSVPGVAQSQVRPDIGYTFANGLRNTLRQDPDVILVGEIRDSETAKLAIQASLTGHLVLSTIHTNTAAGIIPRLVDMGVDPYLIPPTLVLGIAQRLVRKICPDTGLLQKVEGSIRSIVDQSFSDMPEEYRIKIPEDAEVLKLEPTPNCPNGTRGRIAVHEMYEMDREMEDVILKKPVESAIYDIARKKGMLTMKEDAILKAINKQIPFEEVNKL